MTSRNLALITGGAKRIGADIAKRLAALGYDIAITYNNSKEEAAILCDEIVRNYI